MNQFKFLVGDKVRLESEEAERAIVDRQILVTGEPVYRLDPSLPDSGEFAGGFVPECALTPATGPADAAAQGQGAENEQGADAAAEGQGEQQPA
jgi:hypothetical protein